jgi:hypothetical protein
VAHCLSQGLDKCGGAGHTRSVEGELHDIVVAQTRVSLGRDGAMRLVMPSDTVITVELVRHWLAAMDALTGSSPLPLLVDLPRYANGDAAARRVFSSPEMARRVTRVALVFHTPVMRVVGLFMMRLRVASFPMRLFDNEPAALEWVTGHVLD